MFEGFKKFLMRGNVLDLAIAVVIGTAFATVVKTVVDNLVSPLIASLGGNNVNGLAFYIVKGNEASKVDVAAIINAFIVFFLTAAVVLLRARRPDEEDPGSPRSQGRHPEEDPEPLTMDQELLTEIRDALRARP